MKMRQCSKVLAVAMLPIVVQGVKIAFVGDTGMDDESSNGYGHLTMKMIEDENVDLVVDVGDFDYWGRCTETYELTNMTIIESLTGDNVELPKKAKLKRVKRQDGKYGDIKGWEIGIQPSSVAVAVGKSFNFALDGDFYQRHVMSEKAWKNIKDNLKLKKGNRDCGGTPWDGPWEWNKFLRGHAFDFLGASGNAEVKEAPLYGSAEIWAAHQEHMHKLYMERIYDTKRGACHGYYDQTEPGTVDEYGERFSCYYNNNSGKEDFQFLFLGWWQGSNERNDDPSREQRKKTIDFIEREFSDERSQNVRWRFCIQHMTSAKLSSGEKNRDNMVLARITDTCRKHGAIIISGHHHHYSRTKILQAVGNQQGGNPVVANGDSSKLVISEGLTMSVTAGMGGYDGACNGKYWNATWMEKCVARPSDHRGAVIAAFDESDTTIGTFQYMNSMKNGEIVDEFQIHSNLPGSGTRAPTNKPTFHPTPKVEPTLKPTNDEEESPPKNCVTALNFICSPFYKFSYFCKLLKNFGLEDALSTGNKPLTVLAPTNDAFEALKGHEVFDFDKDTLKFNSLTEKETEHVLLYHIINTQDIVYTDENLICGNLTESANGEKFRTRCDGKNEEIKIVRGPSQTEDLLPEIEFADINICNGVLHFLSNVMLPNLNKAK